MDKVIDILERIGIPYAYHHFAEGEGPDAERIRSGMRNCVRLSFRISGQGSAPLSIWKS